MYTHMEYLQKCFCKSTGWNEDNVFANILATSNALIDFSVPNGGKLDVSSQATAHSASSMTLSNHNTVNGSLAYLYSSVPIRNAAGTKDVSLQDAIAGFRIIDPQPSSPSTISSSFNRASLVYGRMYFPGSALEAMVIRRLSPSFQVLVKCISNPLLKRNGSMIVYLQENRARYSREYIFSSNEALIGFRCLYNFGSAEKSLAAASLPKFDNSVVSAGAELWYAARSMSPGLSTAIRYSTRSTYTGKPLTMTLSCNPILGHVSSTYNVKTSVASTVCSKYDFNWFSYSSNLSLGFELYNYSKHSPGSVFYANQPRAHTSIHHDTLAPSPSTDINALSSTSNISPYSASGPVSRFMPPDETLNDTESNQEVMTAFQNLVNESNFSSVLKASTSLSDRKASLLWVGRYKDFLISTGVKFGLANSMMPEFSRMGVTFAYAC